MDRLKVCFIGFGNVGQRFSELLLEKKDWLAKTYGREIVVTGISARSKGSLVDPDGIDLAKALADVQASGAFAPDDPARFTGTPEEMMAASGAEVLFEMSTLNIENGLPAADYMRYALDHGMHVITANKGPEAWYYDELKDKAAKAGLQYLFETIVLDGTPTFNLMTETLAGNNVSGIMGILNGTSNFVLKQLQEGISFDDAIKAAQDIGLAEADPSMDIDGWDGAAKICAMANILMDARITPPDVEVESVRNVTAEDLADARSRGMCIKYICRAARMDDGSVKVTVKPEELPREHAYNSVNGTSAVFTLYTDLAGELTMIQTDPGLLQTAYGLYSDLITLLKRV